MTPCLDDVTIERLTAGDLDGAALEAVDAHLDACASCRERVARAARMIPATVPSGAARARAEAVEPLPDALVGRLLEGRYLVRRRIGGGAMGTVYEGEHALIGRRVAIKVLQHQWAQHREVVRRFSNEARAAGALGHPGILSALDLGRTEDGRPFLVLEYLEGEDLEAMLARTGPLSVARAARLAARIADALAAAHAAGIVHRDVKPENVFLTSDGGLKVLDFGISKITSTLATGPGTGPGAVMGTPMYMAPEQIEDAARADARSDVYSLGVLLYRALTGALPFSAGSLPSLLLAIVAGEAPSARASRPDLPEAFDAIVRRAMSADPSARFSTMDELAAALEPFAAGADEEPSGAVAIDRRVATVLAATGVRDVTEAARMLESKGGRRLLVAIDGALVGVFGDRTWHGEEPVRAVEAALAIRALASGVAVASGHLVASGEELRGEPIERALEAAARGLGGVAVIDPGTRLDSRFVLRRWDDELAEVVEAVPTSVLPPPSDVAPLVGREVERAQLAEAIARVTDEGSPRVVAITGEPGAGKSRLAAEAIAMCEQAGLRVLVGRGVPRGGRQLGALAEALSGFSRELTRLTGAPRIDASAPLDERREAVRELIARAAAEDEREVATFVGELLGVSMPPTTDLSAARGSPRLMRDRLTLAVRAVLEGFSREGPLALVLDDLQWVDAESLALLEQMLSDALWDRPVLVLGTARAELWSARPPFDAADTVEIKLRGLGLGDVRALAEAAFGLPLDDALARALLDRTGGNPLFVEETVRALAQKVPLSLDGPLPLPLDVEAAVQARLEVLDAPRRAALECLAVIGAASAQELEQLDVERPSRTIGALVKEGLVRRRPGPDPSAPRYELRTSLTAEVLYASIPDARRASLHLAAAAVIGRRAETEPEALAFHFDRAGAASDASRAYHRAALAAARQQDAARVLRCARRALELGAPDEARFALHLACADALEHEGKLDEQAASLDRAASVAASSEERARVAMAQAVRTLRREGPMASLARFEDAVAHAQASHEPAVLARVLGAHATALVVLGRVDEAAGVLGEAERLVSTRVPSLRAELASWRAQLAAAQGDLGARRSAFLSALELYAEVGDERSQAGVSVNLGDVLNRFGAYGEAEVTLMQARTRCRRLGMALMEGYALVNLGYARLMSGRLELARIDLARADELATRIGDAHLSTWAAIYGARLSLAEGDAADAAAWAETIATRAEQLGLGAAQLAATVLLAEARLEGGYADSACETAERAADLRDALGGAEEAEAELYAVHARALAAVGRDDEAERVLARARRWLDSTARRIADLEWRRRFREDVPAHRALA